MLKNDVTAITKKKSAKNSDQGRILQSSIDIEAIYVWLVLLPVGYSQSYPLIKDSLVTALSGCFK